MLYHCDRLYEVTYMRIRNIKALRETLLSGSRNGNIYGSHSLEEGIPILKVFVYVILD
jgi:hypothetical protein